MGRAKDVTYFHRVFLYASIIFFFSRESAFKLAMFLFLTKEEHDVKYW